MKQADYIIRGGYLLTMDDDAQVINDGAVAVTGTDIAAAGSYSAISKEFTSDRVIGSQDMAVFPGLINTHNHAAMVYFRGIADDLPLMEWLEKYIWPAEMKWPTSEVVRDALVLCCLGAAKAGVTTYTDMYLYQDVAAQKAEQIGIRGVLCSGVIDFPWRDYAQSSEDYFARAEKHITKWKGNELITPGIAPHATFTCSPDNYMRAREIADKYDVPLHTHLAETQFEAAQCRERYGKTPVEHLDSIGFLTGRVSAAHCVWLTDREIEILADRKVGVSHCIESNLKLASGIAPVPAMLKAGIRVSLGTDGAASNNDLSILGEMSTAAKVHKGSSLDATVIDSRTALAMATKNGADMMGLGSSTGTITPGKKADIVMARIDSPHMTPVYDMFSHITYCLRPSDIDTVMVNGKVLVENGSALTINEGEVIAKAREWQEKISQT